MKNKNGITLISLAITIVVLIILASITTYSGISSINSSKLTLFKQELEIMQAQVDILYEKYKDEETIEIGKLVSEVDGTILNANTAYNSLTTEQKSKYRYFDKQIIQNLDIAGIEREYLVNIKDRDLICLEGFEKDGKIYYTLKDLAGENLRVESSGIERNGVNFSATSEYTNAGNWRITVSDIDFSKYVGKGILQYSLKDSSDWITVKSSIVDKEYKFTIKEEGNYVVRITDAAGEIGERDLVLAIDKTSLKFSVNSGDDGIVVMPIEASLLNIENGYTIDWGDGTTGDDGTIVASKDKRVAAINGINIAATMNNGIAHTYKDKNKEYVVTISGICEAIDTHYNNVTHDKIIKVLQWGETQLNEIYLGYCINLRQIASPTNNSFINLDPEYGLDGAFRWCTSLTEIPSDLFANCPQIISFHETFYGCENLKKISPNLFDKCQNIENFVSTFANCSDLTGTAPNLWIRGTNTEANAYQGIPDGRGCFYNCTGLSNYELIPEYWRSSAD